MELCQILVTDFGRTELFEDDLITLIWSNEWANISIDVCDVAAEVTTQTKNINSPWKGSSMTSVKAASLHDQPI